MVVKMFEIIKKNRLNSYITEMCIYAPLIAKKALPGQFIILRVDPKGERIPLTISDCSQAQGTINIIYQRIGKTTIHLDQQNEGDTISDIAGPLGKASELSGFKKSIVIGGGTGCAIVYPQAKYLSENGTEVHVIAGFRNKDFIILEDKMKKISHSLDIVTDDGSNGDKGLVTNVLENKLKKDNNYDSVIAVGPLPMMKAVCEITKRFNIKTIVSMNSIMIDGTGMCGGCRLTVGGKVKFACVDGPDFDGHKVDFDEAIKRNNAYKRQESLAREKYCKLIKGVEDA